MSCYWIVYRYNLLMFFSPCVVRPILNLACNSITNGVYMLANCSVRIAIIWPFMAPGQTARTAYWHTTTGGWHTANQGHIIQAKTPSSSHMAGLRQSFK